MAKHKAHRAEPTSPVVHLYALCRSWRSGDWMAERVGDPAPATELRARLAAPPCTSCHATHKDLGSDLAV